MGTRSDLHTWLSGCRGLCREKSNTGWLGTVPGVDERDPGTRRRSSSGPAVWGTRVQPHGGDRPCGGGGVEQYWWGSCRWSLCKLMHLLPKDQWGSAGAPPGTDLKGVKMLDGKDVGTPTILIFTQPRQAAHPRVSTLDGGSQSGWRCVLPRT